MEFERGDLLTLFGQAYQTKKEYEIGKWLILEKKKNRIGMIYYEAVIVWVRRGYYGDDHIPGLSTTLAESYLINDCWRVEVQRGQLEKC